MKGFIKTKASSLTLNKTYRGKNYSIDYVTSSKTEAMKNVKHKYPHGSERIVKVFPIIGKKKAYGIYSRIR